jgi:hypothetical protein
MRRQLLLAHVKPDQARLLLTELANLGETRDSLSRLQHSLKAEFNAEFNTVLPELQLFGEGYEALKATEPEATQESGFVAQTILERLLIPLRDWLRRIWINPNMRHKELLLLGLREYVRALRSDLPRRVYRIIPVAYWGNPDQPEEPSALEQALIWLLKSADKTRCCPHPDCPSPYFLAKRRNQRYCSEVCAQRGERELKQKWWQEHGEQWRRQRQKKSLRKRGR